MENVNWIKAPPNWEPDAPNPFSPSGEYGNDWSAFTFISGSPSRLHYPGRCRSDRGCFTPPVGPKWIFASEIAFLNPSSLVPDRLPF